MLPTRSQASWNMGLLQSKDLLTAAQATMQKQEGQFEDMLPKHKL